MKKKKLKEKKNFFKVLLITFSSVFIACIFLVCGFFAYIFLGEFMKFQKGDLVTRKSYDNDTV